MPATVPTPGDTEVTRELSWRLNYKGGVGVRRTRDSKQSSGSSIYRQALVCATEENKGSEGKMMVGEGMLYNNKIFF